MYSKTVMDHFKNPRNMGEMSDADAIGEVGNPVCGDLMYIYIKVKNDKIDDIKLFKEFLYKESKTFMKRKFDKFNEIDYNFKRDYSLTKTFHKVNKNRRTTSATMSSEKRRTLPSGGRSKNNTTVARQPHIYRSLPPLQAPYFYLTDRNLQEN
jgi:hypothetical protein